MKSYQNEDCESTHTILSSTLFASACSHTCYIYVGSCTPNGARSLRIFRGHDVGSPYTNVSTPMGSSSEACNVETI